MAISKAKDPSVMMFPSDFLLLLALLREVVDRAHGGHGGLHGGGGRASAAAQGARNSKFVQKLKNILGFVIFEDRVTILGRILLDNSACLETLTGIQMEFYCHLLQHLNLKHC